MDTQARGLDGAASRSVSIWGVIPARKGSKGIPFKNRALLGGKELIRYTFEAAAGSRRLSRILLSTDDEEIVRIAGEYPRVEVPYLRPAALATDSAKSADVVTDLFRELGEVPDYVVLLQPTTPLRTAEQIDSAVGALLAERANFDSLVSLCRIDEPHPLKAKKIEDGLVKPYLPGSDTERPRQELPAAYRLNGAIYCIEGRALKAGGSFFSSRTMPFLMSEEASVNIDGPLDLRFAEFVLRG